MYNCNGLWRFQEIGTVKPSHKVPDINAIAGRNVRHYSGLHVLNVEVDV